MPVNFIVVTIVDGTVVFISQCKTRKGAERSARSTKELRSGGDRKVDVRILSVQDILNWDDNGTRELETLYKL